MNVRNVVDNEGSNKTRTKVYFIKIYTIITYDYACRKYRERGREIVI